MFHNMKMDSLVLASLILLVTICDLAKAQESVSPDISSRDAVAPIAIAPKTVMPQGISSGKEISPDKGISQATEDGPSIDEVFEFKKLSEISLDIHDSTDRKPVSKFTELPTKSIVEPAITVYMWEAPAIRYQPLFFEDPTLERYGQDAGLLTPAVSGAHFFGRVLTLPFQAVVRSPFSCDYPLGYGRPGNDNAYLHYQFPW